METRLLLDFKRWFLSQADPLDRILAQMDMSKQAGALLLLMHVRGGITDTDSKMCEMEKNRSPVLGKDIL